MGLFKNIGSNILGGLRRVGGFLKQNLIRPVVETIAGNEDAIGDIASTAINGIGGAIGGIPGAVAAKAITTGGSKVWNWIKDWVRNDQPEIFKN